MKTFLILLVICLASCRVPESKPEPITTLACYDGQPRMSPDGKFIAFVSTQSGDRHIWIYDVGEQTRTPLTYNEGVDEHPDFSPNNERLVFSSLINGQRDLWLIDQESQLVQLTKTETEDEYSPRWSKDGNWIYFVMKDSLRWNLCKVSHKNFSDVQILYTDSLEIENPIPISDGRVLLQKSEGTASRLYFWSDRLEPFSKPAMDVRHAALSPDERWIIFVNTVEDSSVICLSSVEQFDPKPVKLDLAQYDFPSWSTDGKKILFEKTPSWDIKQIEVETQRDSVLVADRGEQESPVYSRDGKCVIYSSSWNGKQVLMELNLETGKREPLLADFGNCSSPDISQDGTKLLFTSDKGGKKNIWIMNRSEDAQPERLTDDPVAAHQARFSGNAQWMVYVSDRSGNPDIWKMELTSKKETRMTVDERVELAPSFSMDDQAILFQANWAKRWSIWRMPADGGIPLPVTRDKLPYGWDADPLVSPDGKRLLFTRSWYDDADVWLLSVSGGEKTSRTLTKDNTNQERNGQWSPDGKYVVFQAGHNTDIWMMDISSMLK
ncbi:hypothetical protein K1X84_15920 [bacterium]|nr:hypothetical protein [bacterium]